MIDLYLKYDICVFKIIFVVTAWHEWDCGWDGIGVEKRRCRESLAAQSLTLINREEPDHQNLGTYEFHLLSLHIFD